MGVRPQWLNVELVCFLQTCKLVCEHEIPRLVKDAHINALVDGKLEGELCIVGWSQVTVPSHCHGVNTIVSIRQDCIIDLQSYGRVDVETELL